MCMNPQNFNGFTCACSACPACLLRRSNEWARRIIHESTAHDYTTFLTLTYNDNMLEATDETPEFSRDELRKYFARLRKAGLKFRYFAISDKGAKGTERLHFHIILFGVRHDDARLRRAWQVQTNTKDLIDFGFIKSKIFEGRNAHYVASYVSKIFGHNSFKPYCTMSKHNGLIGHTVASSQLPKVYHWLRECARQRNFIRPQNISVFRSYIRFYRKNYYFNYLWKKIIDISKKVEYNLLAIYQQAYTRLLKKFKGERHHVEPHFLFYKKILMGENLKC